MTDAPKRIWAVEFSTGANSRSWTDNPKIGGLGCRDEYHLARPGQPCTDLEFMRLLVRLLVESGMSDRSLEELYFTRMWDWLTGNFAAAMEGLE